MKRLPLLAVVSWLSVCYSPSLADFADGLAAFDAGDYESAYAEWRDLAEAGDLEAQAALAALYLSGKGTPADPVEASDFMEREIVTEIYRRMVRAQNEFAQ